MLKNLDFFNSYSATPFLPFIVRTTYLSGVLTTLKAIVAISYDDCFVSS